MELMWLILFALAVLFLLFIIIRKIRPWWKKILLLLLAVVAIGFTAIQVLFPVHPMVATTGEASVSQSKDYFTYETSEDAYETSDGSREVPVSLWHPESVDEINGKLVLFSHGSFGVPDSNETLFNELASHGYVVASLGHPHHSFTTTLSDGSEVTVDFAYLQKNFSNQGSEDAAKVMNDLSQWAGVHENDLTTVIEAIQAGDTDNEFLTAVNSDEVILMGHSLGGTASLNLGRNRDDIAGVVALEAPFVGDIEEVNDDSSYEFTSEPYPVPILHIYSDATWDILNEWTLYEQNWNYVNADDPQYTNEHIAGSGHIGLTDLNRASPILTNFADGGINTAGHETILKAINDTVLPFLDEL